MFYDDDPVARVNFLKLPWIRYAEEHKYQYTVYNLGRSGKVAAGQDMGVGAHNWQNYLKLYEDVNGGPLLQEPGIGFIKYPGINPSKVVE